MKIKLKFAFFFLAGTFLIACKKDYSCSCTHTNKDVGEGGITTVSTENYTIENATKDQARSACNEAKITQTYSVPNSPSIGTYETICELSK